MGAITEKDLERLAEIRVSETIHLFTGGHFSGAYYLAGYAVELGLKACIAGTFQPGTLPDKGFVVSNLYTRLAGACPLGGIERGADCKKQG
jgi:hypothetical protein